MSLENRTAVIGGAAGELGSVLARDLLAQGVNLALLGRPATAGCLDQAPGATRKNGV